MRLLLRMSLFALLVLCTSQVPAQWFLRGEFNGWSGNAFPMADQGGGHFAGSVTGLTPGNTYQYKVASEDWSTSYPGNNGKITANAAGEADFHFYDGANSDGWQPSAYSRVGYEDHQQYDWELIGTVNDVDWSGGPEYYLTDLGDGLHRLLLDLDAGSYEFKFRKQGDWNVNIGENFGDNAANAQVTIPTGTFAFELDLPGGRWRVVQVPEPSTMALGALALVGVTGLARRRK